MLSVFALGHRREFEATQPEILRSTCSTLKQKQTWRGLNVLVLCPCRGPRGGPKEDLLPPPDSFKVKRFNEESKKKFSATVSQQ